MLLQQYNYIGIDLSAEYIKISKSRIEAAISSIDKDKEPAIEPSKCKDKIIIEEDNMFFYHNI